VTTFWAHSDRSGLPEDAPEAQWQRLSEHLANTASLARRLASLTAPADFHFHDLAEIAGLLHDFGKYSDCFQRRIQTGQGRCPHAIHGAILALSTLKAQHIAQAIAGHHAGMPDPTGGTSSLRARVEKYQTEALSLRDRAIADSHALCRLLQNSAPAMKNAGHRYDLLTRMLFSCLVDADRLDSSGRQPVQAPLRAAERLDQLLNYIQELPAGAADPVALARNQILEDCLSAAEKPNRLLSLSVPTGGGKTLSSMAFALKRAALNPGAYRRIVIVIPYLSIIEQNAEVYANVFGTDAILEHHSGSFEPLKPHGDDHFLPEAEEEDAHQSAASRPETENWDAPIVITTSVRFFESLFSNHPSDLRRIHNIARSIVILDEVQVLPRPLLGPLLAIIRELADDWGCSFVLSTATQPAFERRIPQQPAEARRDLRWGPGTVSEIVRKPAELYASLRRVAIEWRTGNAVDWPQVAGWLQQHQQALCVVNTREHASRLYDEMAARLPDTGSLIHLSTRMCAAHRLGKIRIIRDLLKRGQPCLVVSTQLIEAGVDIDFPVVYRSLGPLDSIIQSAGRADREGKITALNGSPGGRMIVFLPQDHRMPPGAYSEAAGITQALAGTRDIQSDDLDTMALFFDRYYGEGADLGSKYIEHRRKAEFAALANEFEMISTRTQDVFVPFGEGIELIEKLDAIGQLTGELRKRLQRYVVGLNPKEFAQARGSVLRQIRGSDLWAAVEPAYSPKKGLELSLRPESLVK
jgi:CRISPR-associated endonuclease/helicase Cas3